MIDLLSLLAAAPVSALPPDAAVAAAAAPAAELNYLQLVLHASWPVLIVMLLLVLASVMSWFVIFRKMGVFSRAGREADDFENRFWSGAEITALYRAATDRNRVVTGMEAIFEAGYREYAASGAVPGGYHGQGSADHLSPGRDQAPDRNQAMAGEEVN